MILKVVIDKFRLAEDLEIEIGKNLTAICGQNGTMKSTLLGCIAQPFGIGRGRKKDDKKEKATELLKECFSSSKATELKAKIIWDKKKDKLIEFINKIIDEAKAIPCFVIMDKKYMIAAKIVETFLNSDFEGGRHQRRVDKIKALEENQ